MRMSRQQTRLQMAGVIAENNPESAYVFAITPHGLRQRDIETLEKVVLRGDDARACALWARDVSARNLPALEQRIIETATPTQLVDIAKDYGDLFDVDRLQARLIAHPDVTAKHCKRFLLEVRDVDGLPLYERMWSLNMRNWSEEKLERELTFANGFEHPAQSPAERCWRAALEAEAARREAAAEENGALAPQM